MALPFSAPQIWPVWARPYVRRLIVAGPSEFWLSAPLPVLRERTSHQIGPEDDFLIVASDGVWEFIENDEAIRIVSDVRPPPAPEANRRRRARRAVTHSPRARYPLARARCARKVFDRGGTATAACTQLIARAAMQWKRFEGNDYRDDITAEVLYLQKVVGLLDSQPAPASSGT